MVNREAVIAWLNSRVPQSRLQHILGVEQLADELAVLHGLDAKKAKIAGLMHDLAKNFSPQGLLVAAREANLEIDAVCQNNPHLLHADVGAIVARTEFRIEDREILNAIANHTLGQPEMSLLSCVVYVADALEPSRGDSSELEAMRRLSRDNLYESVWRVGDASLRYLLDRGGIIHPRTILTRNWAMVQSRRPPDSKVKKKVQ